MHVRPASRVVTARRGCLLFFLSLHKSPHSMLASSAGPALGWMCPPPPALRSSATASGGTLTRRLRVGGVRPKRRTPFGPSLRIGGALVRLLGGGGRGGGWGGGGAAIVLVANSGRVRMGRAATPRCRVVTAARCQPLGDGAGEIDQRVLCGAHVLAAAAAC